MFFVYCAYEAVIFAFYYIMINWIKMWIVMSCWKEVLKYKTLATWNLSTQIIILEIQNYVAIALCTLLCTSLSANSINLNFYIVLLFILFNTFHYCLFERRTHGIKIVFSMDSVTINYSPMRLECCYTSIILFGFRNG